MTSSDLSHMQAQGAEPTVDRHSSSMWLCVLSFSLTLERSQNVQDSTGVLQRVLAPIKSPVIMDSNHAQCTARSCL